MPLITSAGVGSGLDLESIISATVNAENQPKQLQFESKKTEINVELSSIGAVKSSLSALDSIIAKLSDPENFSKRTATLTQPTSGNLISVSTNATSTPGDFDIEVMQLSQGSRAVSNPGLFTAPTDIVSATGGNLTFTAGTKSFVVNVAANASLEDIRTAINDASDNFGVSVNIVNTGGASPESKLVYTSSITGDGNDLSITNDIAELDNVSTVAFGGGAGGISIAAVDQAKDAIIEVDGIAINSSTNKFVDAVQDLTITVLKKSENNETANLKVDYDKTGVAKTVESFIEAFNNAVGTIDYHTQLGGGLAGDSSMRSLRNQLINTLSSTLSGAGNFQTIFDVGLGLDKKGKLEKSSLVTTLTDSLSDFYTDVGNAFSGAGGISGKFASLLDNYVESNGALKFRQDSLNKALVSLENDKLNHNYRMEQLEITLRNQYSALDVLVARMQSSGQFLTQQLASLPGFTRQSSK